MVKVGTAEQDFRTIGTDSVNFIENVRWLMEARGISQRAMASKLGTSPAYVSRVLHFEIFPSLPRCEEIARSLRVPIQEFFLTMPEFERKYPAGRN